MHPYLEDQPAQRQAQFHTLGMTSPPTTTGLTFDSSQVPFSGLDCVHWLGCYEPESESGSAFDTKVTFAGSRSEDQNV